MTARSLGAIVLVAASPVFAGVFSYEADSLPQDAGWDVSQIVCDPQLWIEDGWFFLRMTLCPGDPPPGGQIASYRRYISDFIGVETFFMQWRVETDADQSEIDFGGGVAIAAGDGWGPVRYTFFITKDLVKLNRDNSLPIIFVDIELGVPHTYRLELYGADLYVWYIDGEVVDSGMPEAAYPDYDPSIVWYTKTVWLPNDTQWDYIRFGTIAEAGTGDYDSDGDIDRTDLYFFQDCLLGPDGGGPGCQWADMNADGTTNGADIGLFVDAMLFP